MSQEFSRIITLLRKERNITQKEADEFIDAFKKAIEATK